MTVDEATIVPATHDPVNSGSDSAATLDDVAAALAAVPPAERPAWVAKVELAAADLTPDDAVNDADLTPAARIARASDDGYRIVSRSYADIAPVLTDWLWDGRIPRRALSLFVGTEGLGKTAMGIQFVARLTTGTLPGCFEGTPVNVALLTPEDDAAATIRTRLEAAGADLSRVFDYQLKNDEHAKGVSLPGDTAKLVDGFIRDDVRFAFVDPLASILDPSLNSWQDTDVRRALEPLVLACTEHDVTIVGTLHTNKKASTNARDRGMGSAGWRQIARASFWIGLDPDDPAGAEGSSRCIGHDKHNLGPWTRTHRFVLETVSVAVQGTRQDTVRAVLGDECDVTVPQMLAAEQGFEDPKAGAMGAAETWLTKQLADGPVAVTSLNAAADRDAVKWRTVERAKSDLGVKASKTGNGWVWTLKASGGLEP
jgi:hypothetical protein